jgi:hypothetical protein
MQARLLSLAALNLENLGSDEDEDLLVAGFQKKTLDGRQTDQAQPGSQ